MSAHPHHLGPWEFEPTREEGCAFAIYPETTSEPLAYVAARDGAEDIARRMAAASDYHAAAEELLEEARLLGPTSQAHVGGLLRAIRKLRAAHTKATGVSA